MLDGSDLGAKHGSRVVKSRLMQSPEQIGQRASAMPPSLSSVIGTTAPHA